MPRKKASEESTALEAITDTQQTFIQALLSGKNITEAALVASVSRRTATYWMMHNNNPVRIEYEKQRLALRQEFYNRVATLHELALKALEDSLSPDAPPAIRFQAARFLYEAHLQAYFGAARPRDGGDLADEE